MARHPVRMLHDPDRLPVGEPFGLLLAAAQANAPWAFERLYRSLAPSVLGYLRLQGAAEAEDLTSEVFLGAFRGLAFFRGDEGQFRSWLFTIAHRRLVDERRRWGRRPQIARDLTAVPEPVGGDVEDEALFRMGGRRVEELCRGLLPDQRDVLLLRLVAGLTVEQVSATLGKSTAAVKALQRRGLAGVRRQIEPEGATV